jgi:hypothetical protein
MITVKRKFLIYGLQFTFEKRVIHAFSGMPAIVLFSAKLNISSLRGWNHQHHRENAWQSKHR